MFTAAKGEKMLIVEGRNRAVIAFYSGYDEYRVKFYRGNHYLNNADYFTDSKSDAIDTANEELKRMTGGN